MSGVDLASFGNDFVVEPSTVPPSYDALVPPDDLYDFMHFTTIICLSPVYPS